MNFEDALQQALAPPPPPGPLIRRGTSQAGQVTPAGSDTPIPAIWLNGVVEGQVAYILDGGSCYVLTGGGHQSWSADSAQTQVPPDWANIAADAPPELVNGIFTASSDGRYQFVIGMTGASSGEYRREFRFLLNGVVAQQTGPGDTTYGNPAATFVRTLTAGDAVTIQLDSDAGGGTGVSNLHIEIDRW
jgi:hypothetical protein